MCGLAAGTEQKCRLPLASLCYPAPGNQACTIVCADHARLRRTMEQARFFAGSPRSVEHLTISIGISVFDDDAQFKRALIENADGALYAAKKSGRNKVVLYSDLASRQREVS